MSDRFTGKAIPKGISLPADMWAYLEARRDKIGIPVSVQVQRALEDAIFAEVESRHSPTLVDSPVEYEMPPAGTIKVEPNASIDPIIHESTAEPA